MYQLIIGAHKGKGAPSLVGSDAEAAILFRPFENHLSGLE